MRRRRFIATFGAAAAVPVVALAQARAVPVVGFLTSRAPGESAHHLDAFLRSLKESGFVEGRTVRVEARFAEGHYDRLPALAQELLRANPTVLVAAGGSPSALAAKAATATVPIVFLIGNDAVRLGVVDSYNRPGANLTGITFITTELGAKRVGFLAEMLPELRRIALLQNPANPDATFHRQGVEAATAAIGRDMIALDAATGAEIDRAFGQMARESASALIVQNDPFFDSERDRIVRLAARDRIPAIYHIREYPENGGLVSYGASLVESYRQLGLHTARVLRGDDPRDLPVLRATRFELVVNLKTAATLGLTVPESILARADEVID